MTIFCRPGQVPLSHVPQFLVGKQFRHQAAVARGAVGLALRNNARRTGISPSGSTKECCPRIRSSRVEPDRGSPTIKIGAALADPNSTIPIEDIRSVGRDQLIDVLAE